LFVTSFGQTNSLFRNVGNSTFAKANAGTLVTEAAEYDGTAWGDYDNDGFLDLFITHGSVVQGSRVPNFLYRNSEAEPSPKSLMVP